MRRKLTTLRAKQGHSQNGAPRSLIDDCFYRQIAAIHLGGLEATHCDSEYSGWNQATRPRDQAISLRRFPPLPSPPPD